MRKCEVVESGNPFAFVCNATQFVSVVQKITTVISFSASSKGENNHYVVASSENNLFVLGYSSDSFVGFHIDGVTTSDEGSFEFSPDALVGLLKKRGDMEFEYKNGRLYFKETKGRYKADVTTTSITSEQIPFIRRMFRSEHKSVSLLSPDLLSSLRTAMKVTQLQNVYRTEEPIISLIRVKKGVLEVSALDNYHMAYYRAEVDTDSRFELALPAAMFRLIDKFVSDEGQSVEFAMSSKSFVVNGNTYMITMPPVQIEDDAFARVPGYLKTLKDPVAEFSFSDSGVKTVDNMLSISGEETKLSIAMDPSCRIDIALSTEHGTVSDAFKSKGAKIQEKMSVLVDPRIFNDLFSKVRDLGAIPVRLYQKKNKGVTSCFVIRNTTETTKLYLVGTYYEE